jgi:hypothetical protein
MMYSVFEVAFLFRRVDLKSSEINETFEMDEERPTTSASIFLESARPGTPAASTLLDDSSNVPAITSFTTAPGVMLPPHHAFKHKGLKSSKPSFKPGQLLLSYPKEPIEAKNTSLKANVEHTSQSPFKTNEDPFEFDDSSQRTTESRNTEVGGLSAIDITKIEI